MCRSFARLRLSSIDSIEVDATLMAAIAEEERLMPHLHLSLQHGDDMILKRMKRRHRRADAVRFAGEVRRLRPDVVFGADLIAGFPTETRTMFGNALSLVDECGLTYLHVFPFSPRQGTPAARMPQLDRAPGQGARRAPARQGRGGACRPPRRARPAPSAASWSSRPASAAPSTSRRPRSTPARPATIVAARVTGRTAAPLVATALPRGGGLMAEAAAASSAASSAARRRPKAPPHARQPPARRHGWFQRLKAGLARSSTRAVGIARRVIHASASSTPPPSTTSRTR